MLNPIQTIADQINALREAINRQPEQGKCVPFVLEESELKGVDGSPNQTVSALIGVSTNLKASIAAIDAIITHAKGHSVSLPW